MMNMNNYTPNDIFFSRQRDIMNFYNNLDPNATNTVYVEGIPFATASTPMLLIKKPMEKHNEFILSGKPVYYRDFQATILKYAGLYEDQFPAEEFGKTIDDFDEHEERMRVWFDTGFNNQKIRKYEYTGDTDELDRIVREGIYEEVDSLEYEYEGIQ